jgi:hypothetical protein
MGNYSKVVLIKLDLKNNSKKKKFQKKKISRDEHDLI